MIFNKIKSKIWPVKRGIMSIESRNISLGERDQNFTCLEGVRIWAQQHPTIVKILKIAGLILGVGLLASLPFTAPALGLGFTASLAITGGLFVLVSLASLFASNSADSSNASHLPPSSFEVPSQNQDHDAPTFQDIDSSVLEHLPVDKTVLCREDFFELADPFSPPLIGKSEFVSKAMVEHLMRHKKDSALGVKYVPGDQITNMEGALHTFVTPVASILMTGDYKWVGHLQGKPFGNNQMRKVLLSAAIHPDCEDGTVVMRLVKVGRQAVIGAPLNTDDIPSATAKEDSDFRARYEEKLRKHMIYYLSPTHRLPALNEIAPDQIMNQVETQGYLEALIQNPQRDINLQEKFMRIGESIISLELLYQIYVHQVRNEFKVLDANAPQGYVYTISPPSIFARTMGGAAILNRLQALAFQSLVQENLFSNLKVLGFSDYADKTMVPLFQKVLPNVTVLSQTALFGKDGGYRGPQGLALVLHNNSDAFGQNIETEGASSLDGVIGSYSNAASVLKRDRPDLVDFVY
ncbi:MAG: hypothetical protein KGI83_00835 [Verrucomicrobiota bacterium]|nr:hypothetical protein [Verrucomicrobiota bacterium]